MRKRYKYRPKSNTPQARKQNRYSAPQSDPQKKRRWGFKGKTVWDWMNLIAILLVPIVGIWFSIQINETNLQIAKDNRNQDLQIALKHREQDLAIEEDRKRADILKTYMDDITDLYLHEGLSSSKEGDKVRNIATTKTLLTLEQMDEERQGFYRSDGVRKGKLVVFIYELGLMNMQKTIIRLARADLEWADLSDSHLHFANLSGADLSHANLKRVEMSNAVLQRVELRGANLRRAVLRVTDLGEANLSGVDLTDADLRGAHLVSADLEAADLIEVNLADANLTDAYLRGANLMGANLAGVNLLGAQVTNEQLSQVQSLLFATLPNGSVCRSEIASECLR